MQQGRREYPDAHSSVGKQLLERGDESFITTFGSPLSSSLYLVSTLVSPIRFLLTMVTEQWSNKRTFAGSAANQIASESQIGVRGDCRCDCFREIECLESKFRTLVLNGQILSSFLHSCYV
ncbi:hypothetical protein V2G26_000676 [Clonostachys chloroleuca]